MPSDAVLAEARRWLGTPFRHQADVRGEGVDCVMLLVRVYHAAGCIPPIDPRPYPRGWFLRDSRYLDWLAPYTVPREGPPQPADVACFQVGRAPAHAAIVVAWPRVIHADPESGVCEVANALRDLPGRYVCALAPRAMVETSSYPPVNPHAGQTVEPSA